MKIGAAVILVLFSVQLSSALNVHGEKSIVNTTFENKTEVVFEISPGNKTNTSAEVEIKPPLSRWKEYEAEYENNTFRLFKIYNTTDIAHYRYRWVLDNGSAIDGYEGVSGFVVPSENQSMYNYSVNFSNTLPELSVCSLEENDTSCNFEHIQAHKISLNTHAYLATYNETYLNRSLNYTFSSYQGDGGDAISSCNHKDGEFDCSNEDNSDLINTSSGERQGSLIYSLWNLYSVTSNDSVQELAMNYTRGGAENCPVWSESTFDWGGVEDASFTCSEPRGQGSMMLGYWEAYQVTGNETYRGIAENLSSTNFTYNSGSPRIFRGLISAYESTGNETYLNQSEELAKRTINNTGNLSSSEFFELGLGLLEAYEVTGEYVYYRNGIELLDYNASKLNFSCSAISGNFSCSQPDSQTLAGQMYWEGFLNRKDLSRKFSKPALSKMPVTGENLTIDIEMQGKVEDPVMFFRQRRGVWKNCTISFFDGCSLSAEDIANQTVYEFYFNSSKARFPENNGSFSMGSSIIDEDRRRTANRFTDTNNEREGYCRIWAGDFSCEEEYYQPKMMDAMTQSFFNTEYGNYSEKLGKLVTPPYYEDVLNLGFACRPEDNDYSCETASIRESLTGSTRQGNLIESLFSAYSVTEDIEAYRLGNNYIQGNPSDCPVWNGTFTCNSSRGQGAMIKGFLKGYKVTGNETYRHIALNLSKNALNMSNSRRLASAQWKTYSFTSNDTFREDAVNMTYEFNSSCGERNCSPERYYITGELYKNSYLYGSNSFLDDYKFILTGTTTEAGCGPGKDDFTCDNPGLQGSMGELFREASRIIPVTLESKESFTVSSSAVLGSNLNAECSLTNELENTTLEEVEFSLDLSEGLNTTDNITREVGNLNYTNSSTVSWGIEANEIGSQEAACSISSSNGLTEVLERNVEVTEEESDDSDEGSSEDSTGTGMGGAALEPEPKNYTIGYNYNREIYQLNKSFMSDLGINTTFRKFELADSACYSAERNVLENETKLELSYTCSSDGIFVLDELGRNDSSLRIHRIDDLENNISISYPFSANLSAPMLVSYTDLEPLQMDINYMISNRTDPGLRVDIKLNREERCRIDREGDLIYNRTLVEDVLPVDSVYNNTQVEVQCGDLNSSYTFVSDVSFREDPVTEDIPVFLVMLSLSFFLVGSTAIYFRRRMFLGLHRFVIDPLFGVVEDVVNHFDYLYNLLFFQFNLRRFRHQVSNDNSVKAIKTFEKVAQYGGNSAAQSLLQSDIDLMRGVRLYILLELVEESLEEGIEMPQGGDDLEELVTRYLDEVNNPELESMIREKVKEVSEFSQKL